MRATNIFVESLVCVKKPPILGGFLVAPLTMT